MAEVPVESHAAAVAREHRALDQLLGRFFGAAHAGELADAREAMRNFDEELRRHTAFEEERVLPAAPPGSRKLLPGEEESDRDRLARELRLEHVQIRELSAMMLRHLEQDEPEGAVRLAANLARRWDAHTAREEESLGRNPG
jgi:hypothetical protein